MKLTEEQLNSLFQDFEEIPVSFEQFITDRTYLGNSWLDSSGDLKMFPFWLEHGKQAYPLPLRSPYNVIIYAGGTGLGKTTVAVNAIMAYYLYIVLCLKNPHEYFDLAEQKEIVFILLNIVTKSMAYKNAWGLLHKALLKSPWFMARGFATTGKKPEWVCKSKSVVLDYGSSPDHVIGRDILCAFIDEISFARIRNIQAAQERATELVNSAIERMTSRFTKFGGIYEGLLLMASSKRTEQAFLEVFTKKLEDGVAGKRVLVVDKPRWEVLPKNSYCGKTFPVAVGDKFHPSTIIKEEEVKMYDEASYKIIYPPIETYGEFERDLQNALTNIAGISVNNLSTFLSGKLIKEAINPTRKNPFVQSIIYVGSKDTLQYKDFFNISLVHPDDFKKPLFIHVDASLGGDGNSISGVIPAYAKNRINEETGNLEPELHYRQIFKIKVKAPKGDQVMLSKNRQFIYWLKNEGFNISTVSHDQFQSAEFHQELQNKGINCVLQSIDRVTNGINQPYSVLKNALYEHRLELLDDEDQTLELVHLEKYEDGRVDKGEGYEDDASQSLCGAVYAASQCKVEFLRDYGVILSNIDNNSTNPTLPEDAMSSLIQQHFENSVSGAIKVPGITGLREDFDTYVSKNKQKQDIKPGKQFHFF